MLKEKAHEVPALNKGISIVLPAFNEEQNLECLVKEILDYTHTTQLPCEIIIVNDGSSDETGKISEALAFKHKNIRAIHHVRNRGYGKSLRDGLDASTFNYLFFTDADRQFRINSLDAFLPLINNGNIDMVIGYRRDRKDSMLRRSCAWCFNRIVRSLFSLEIKDINCAFKLIKKGAFEKILVTADDSLFNVELLAKARLKKLKIAQVGVNHYPRLKGESTVSYKIIPSIIKRLFVLYREIRDFKKNERYKTANN